MRGERRGTRRWRATYAHATAPLRRLADRYVLRGRARHRQRPSGSRCGRQRLRALARGHEPRRRPGRADRRAVLDLAESVVLQGREGETFDGTVTDIDERGARIQIAQPAIVTRIASQWSGDRRGGQAPARRSRSGTAAKQVLLPDCRFLEIAASPARSAARSRHRRRGRCPSARGALRGPAPAAA